MQGSKKMRSVTVGAVSSFDTTSGEDFDAFDELLREQERWERDELGDELNCQQELRLRRDVGLDQRDAEQRMIGTSGRALSDGVQGPAGSQHEVDLAADTHLRARGGDAE